LKIRDLTVQFDVSGPWLRRVLTGEPRLILKAVDGISLEVNRGESFSLVGESGCGKSTVARAIVGLYPPARGEIIFQGVHLEKGDGGDSGGKLRSRMQMIFQDPYASLDPRWRVFDIIAEPIRAFKLVRAKGELRDRVAQLLRQVSLTPKDGEKYPHEFSGGQRQRISIARALSSNPEFLICDEPTSALDVSVQAQILNLMKELQKELGLTYMFISHDLAIIDHVSDHIGVMYLGRLCEVAPKRSLFMNPRHPYTRLLLETIPDLSLQKRGRQPMEGEVPNPIHPPSGCAFHPRCFAAGERCRVEKPMPRSSKDSIVACHAVEEGRLE
jgi:peptide/nickel transport system ATP-binding protein